MMKKQLQQRLFIAHRGISARYPENTLAAFNGAIDAGAHMIELDVCLSKDRHLVVIHDETVDRTTNGTGPVKTLTLAQLRQLDAGSWFDPRFHAERLPTLSQVLDTVKGHLLVNIEIKPEAFEEKRPADAVERQVLDLVREKNMLDDVLVSSFEWQVLENLRKIDPGIALGLLSEVPADENLLHWYQRIKGFSWHPDFRVLTQQQVNTLHDMGACVFPYAVDGEIDTRGMLAMGVDGLIVDDPRQMI
ncbi:glycerophosphodiester phosphodiesterase family protein [uncultured Desulfosarcina sp.]|uniref:glycerophosphodiester phosphodiesterase n=1 Tax=uncultured Desulfosarcina sp. TaxID=218289 RepID=UPI0029C80FCD|nr:glycerophosphodiester phosphodiesterase family protein [uncultured Desulfosarcina sp.]